MDIKSQEKPKKNAAAQPGNNHNAQTLRLVAEMMASDIESNEARERIVRGMCQALETDASALMLISNDYGDIVIKNSFDENLTWLYQTSLSWNEGLIEKSLKKLAPMIIEDLSLFPQPIIFDAALTFRPKSLFCTPLVYDGQLLGAIAIFNKQKASFSTADTEALTVMAVSIAHSLYSSRLIHQLKIANADLEASRWQLLRSRNTLRALFDNLPTSIYIVDRKYTLLAVNLNRSQRAGQPPNVLVGRRCFEALFARADACPGCRILETLYGGQNTTRTHRVWNEESEPQEWEITTYPILDDQGQVVQAILFDEDVTEKRQMEAGLAQSEKLAAVGQLAAGIAHEINNPLTAVIANAQLLQREIPANDDKQELVDLISRAGARATQVVRNLLDLARKENYNLAPTDVNESLLRAMALVQHEVMARSIKFNFDSANNLPLIKASKDHLHGVWVNLIVNAIDAVEDSAGEIHVTTRFLGNEIVVSVADNGKGIPPEKLNRIFEPFYTTKSPGRGTGLGLSLVHRTVTQHGGRILVNSQIGVGAEFTVILPVE